MFADHTIQHSIPDRDGVYPIKDQAVSHISCSLLTGEQAMIGEYLGKRQ